MCTKTQALEHSSFLQERVVVTLASTKAVAEVLIVLVVCAGLLRMDTTSISCRIQAQGAGARRGQSRRATVACEIALCENLHELVFAMALYGAGVADTGAIVWIGWYRRGRVAGEARKDALTERTEVLCAIFDALSGVRTA